MLQLILFPSAAPSDLARPMHHSSEGERLADSPNIWLTRDFLSPTTVAHMRSKVPKDESAYMPCIGQVDEFDSKRCTILPVAGDELLEAAVAKIGHAWGVDTTRLREGLPLIRYLPGAPPVGKHGDEDRHGVVPNATLVVYLTAADAAASGPSGQTLFPEAGVSVTPQPGAILSFQNVDGAGAPHPKGKHLVSAVPKDAAGDRLVLQIPIAHAEGVAPYAYPEHVSGNKKPGEHEKLHGNADQKAAYQAAVAAGMSIAVAFMAAKSGKFNPDAEEELKKLAQESGKFADADFDTKAQ